MVVGHNFDHKAIVRLGVMPDDAANAGMNSTIVSNFARVQPQVLWFDTDVFPRLALGAAHHHLHAPVTPLTIFFQLHGLQYFPYQPIQIRAVHESAHKDAVADVEVVGACNRGGRRVKRGADRHNAQNRIFAPG